MAFSPNYVYCIGMRYHDRITIDRDRRSGKPCIRNTRICVQDILEYLAGGMIEQQILRDLPELESEDIRATLMFAADRERVIKTIV